MQATCDPIVLVRKSSKQAGRQRVDVLYIPERLVYEKKNS